MINAQGAGFVAGAAAKVGAQVVFPSTDYVFNGKGGPYGESDDPDPINAYGRTKLGGERATALVNGRSFIVRTSWLFGPHGGNFVETMLRLGKDGGPVVVVHDQVGCSHLHRPPGRRPAPPDRHRRLRDPPHVGAREAAPGTSSPWRSSARPRS